jgi:hypothetical protein
MDRKIFAVSVSVILLLISYPFCWAQGVKCVDSDGEAAIVDGDIPSAKMEAVARAKWSAIEKVVGVTVKAGSFVQNMVLFDDAVKTEASGVVRSYDILSQKEDKGLYLVKVKACVEPAKAQKVVSNLSLNNQLALFIPARKPRSLASDPIPDRFLCKH